MKLIRFLLFIIFFAFVGAVFLLGYLGFVPVLSPLMGTNKPKDLGIKYTQKEYDTYVNKAGTEIVEITEPVDPTQSIRYSGEKDLKQSFTQEEISARLNFAHWKYMPVANTQVKIGQDGTIEFSGNILMNRLDGFIARVGMGQYTMKDVEKGLSYIGLIKVNPPIYAGGKAVVANNKPHIAVEQIEVGKFNVPIATVRANDVVTALTNTIISQVNGLFAKSVTFENGKMNFEGTAPEKMFVQFAK